MDEWSNFHDILNSLKCVEEDKEDIEKGYECDHKHAIIEEGNYVCTECNSVIERYIDNNAEWRFYGADDNKSSNPTRCGMPTSELLPNSSLGSIIGYTTKDNYDFKMMRKYHMWNSMSYKERSLYNIFENLNIVAMNSGIPKSILEEAKTLYKQVSENKISRGENRNGLIAASIYMSCKKNRVPRSTKEIAKIFNINSTTMTKGCKRFQDIIKIDMNTTKPCDFINRFCSNVHLDHKQTEICKATIEKAEELDIVSENTPPSIAAGIIFLCNMYFNWGISKKDLAEGCDISQVTITKCYSKLDKYRTSLFANFEIG
jgi:transcription initiation factor TFIIB